ncbi:hypothetical protein CD790_28670 [Streptomyces sp. SAJ15]|nr:hypothetical protein CD790_28670 [Streptomyces sp. SAJ15]
MGQTGQDPSDTMQFPMPFREQPADASAGGSPQTGQWSIPVAGDEGVDESGEYSVTEHPGPAPAPQGFAPDDPYGERHAGLAGYPGSPGEPADPRPHPGAEPEPAGHTATVPRQQPHEPFPVVEAPQSVEAAHPVEAPRSFEAPAAAAEAPATVREAPPAPAAVDAPAAPATEPVEPVEPVVVPAPAEPPAAEQAPAAPPSDTAHAPEEAGPADSADLAGDDQAAAAAAAADVAAADVAAPAEPVAPEPAAAGDDAAAPATAEEPAALEEPAVEAPEAPAAKRVEAAETAEAVPEPAHDEHPYASYVLRVNGADRPVTGAWIGESLLYVLRERLGLAGAKDGCSQGECGACSVQVDGRLVASCLVPAATAAGSEVRTVEGLSADGRLSDVQAALAASGAVQCGFCVPGLAMTVHDLLAGNHAPTELETRQAICGNLCRCSGYRGVLDAVREVIEGREAAAEAEAAEAESAAADAARIPHQAGPPAGTQGAGLPHQTDPHQVAPPGDPYGAGPGGPYGGGSNGTGGTTA